MLPCFDETFYRKKHLHKNCIIIDDDEANQKIGLKRSKPTSPHVEKVRVLHVPSLPNDTGIQYLSFVDDLEVSGISESKKSKRDLELSNRHNDKYFLSNSFGQLKLACRATLPATGTRNHFLVKGREMKAFFRLLDDTVVEEFLEMDSCGKISDKYMLAMVFAYFKRAQYKIREYTRTNFFVALYLANDMEEDEEEAKYEIFPWSLGQKWRDKFPHFLRKRDLFWARIGYRAVVSKRCCEEIMNIEPNNPAWKRTRPLHHAGAIRNYMRDPEDDGYPRGPDATPRKCPDCDNDSQYDSASPASASWYISSGENSPADDHPTSTFDMKRLKKTLQDQNPWPTVEE